MTDTTDTKALRVEIAELRLEIAKAYDRIIPETKIHIKLLERILDQFEAERQQREAAEKECVRIDARNAELNSTLERWSVGRAENANEIEALRGAQEPVGLIKRKTPLLSDGAFRYSLISDVNLPLDTELFTRQPKPVVDLTNVLKVPYRISGQSFAAYDSDDLHAALEADGIVVNDGELATITCWSCRKSMNLAQHSSNDGLCPHCNVEIDLEE
ncbi:hypothetical protein A8A01_03345 [Ewingella americana]|nr:hypothetical protein A8A01_03345 [Ewingella americana]